MSIDDITQSIAAATREYSFRPKVDATAASKVLDEHKPILESLGLHGHAVEEFYKQLQISDFQNSKLYFGESLATLNDAVYTRTAGTASDYVKQRTQVLGELIAVLEKAKETQNPHLIVSFLNEAKAKAKAANKACVHEDEVFKTAQYAVSKDKDLSKLLRSESRSFVYSPDIFEATLKELKERHDHLAEINAVEATNVEKHGAAGGLRDFGWMGVIQTTLMGLGLSKKVNGIDIAGKPIMSDIFAATDESVTQLAQTRTFGRQMVTNVGRLGKWGGRACVSGIKASLSGIATAASTCWSALSSTAPWAAGYARAALLVGKVPVVGWIAAGVIVAVGIGKFLCYRSENPNWAEPVVNTAKAAIPFAWNTAKTVGRNVAAFSPIAIPDVPKLWGSSLFDTNNLEELKNKVRGSQMKGVTA